MNGFAEISHTADIGLEVWADSYSNLFRYAMFGYYKLALSSVYSIGGNKSFTYSDSDYNYENLMVSFLSEINFRLMVEKRVVNQIKFIKIMELDNKKKLEVKGQISALLHPENMIESEIKAVTYHQIKIIEENGIYRTKIFFDI